MNPSAASGAPNEFGLSERTMAEIRAIYAKFPQVARVIVYGSRAMGNFREGSDIDMTIIADGELTHGDVLSIADAFDESYLPYLVDVSDFSALTNPNLIDHINRRGKVLYERASAVPAGKPGAEESGADTHR